MFQERIYRNQVRSDGMKVSYRVVVKETDLLVRSKIELKDVTREVVLRYRGYIESYIRWNQGFLQTLAPWIVKGPAPGIIRDMAGAGRRAGVGPMATVAGAIAEHVGNELLGYTDEVIIENGGDLFIKSNQPVIIGIFANRSPLSLRIGLQVNSEKKPIAVCTSSGTVGHSLSMGKADAVCILSRSCSLADAVATAVGNQIETTGDIQKAIDFGKNIKGVEGLVAIKKDKIGMWGDVEVVPL